MYTVYMHTTPNNKRYIGITSNLKLRWRANGHDYDTQLFWRAIKKYGWDNIKHDVLLTNLSYSWACQLEQILIFQYNTTNPEFGYNRSAGGESSKGITFHHSENTRKQMSESHKGMIFSDTHKRNLSIVKSKQSEETRKKISESHKRENLSLETRRKLSESTKRPCYESTKEKLRQYNLGRKLSEETKLKISKALKGRTYTKHKQ